MNRYHLLALALTVIGCGKSPTNGGPGSYMSPQLTSANPIKMRKEFATCVTNFNNDYNFDLTLYLNGKLTTETKDFKGLISVYRLQDLEGKSISKVTYGEEIAVVGTFKNGQVMSAFFEGTPKNAIDVNICPENRNYHRDSVEAASLNATYYIHEVYKKVSKALPSLYLKPITVSIGSMIKITRFEDGKNPTYGYSVDNATYTPATQTISFLPHSKERRSGEQPNYWDIPLVGAHEYGHHVFHMAAPQKNESTLITGCFNRLHQHADAQSLQGADAVTEVENDLVEMALNEGFADLLASYSLKKEETSMAGVFGLHIDREIDSPYFLMNGEKRFTDFVLRTFFSPRSSGMQLFFQDTHILGAIFAHRVDQFLAGLKLSKEQKLGVILKWVKEYGDTRASMKPLSSRAYLDKMLQIFVRVAVKSVPGTDLASECESIVDFYPGFQSTFPECSNIQ